MSDSRPTLEISLYPPGYPSHWLLTPANLAPDPRHNCKDFGAVVEFKNPPCGTEDEYVEIHLSLQGTDLRLEGQDAKTVRQNLLGAHGLWRVNRPVNIYFLKNGEIIYERRELHWFGIDPPNQAAP